MFFQPSTLNSSNIRNLRLNLNTNQVIVQFINNAKTYLYENVSNEEMLNFLYGEYESAGKFVNAYCKGNTYSVIG